MKVAFIGLGNMGTGMASNIAKAGYKLTVWNRTADKTEPLVALGARASSSPADAVSGADIVITSLMDDKSILDNLEGESGFLAAMAPGSVHVCVTTISPQLADSLSSRHEKHGTRFVAAPVLGRPDASAGGSLIALLAGDEEAIKNATPVINSFASTVIPLGPKTSHAAVLKLCLNYAVISNIELMGEIYACADKAGLSLEMIEGFFKIIYGFPVLHMYAEKLRTRDFSDGGFRMTGGLKDVQLMLDSAVKLGTTFDIGKVIEGKMLEGIDSGYQHLDWSAIYEVTRGRAGLDHVGKSDE